MWQKDNSADPFSPGAFSCSGAAAQSFATGVRTLYHGAVDLNCDMGESFGAWRMGEDAQLVKIVTSASVACGFHAGDPARMEETVQAAVAAGIRIGAHVSYPDLVGFGRRHIQATPLQVRTDTIYQIGALAAICRANGASVSYVKPHGALYHDVGSTREVADAVFEAVAAVDGSMPVVVACGTRWTDAPVRLVKEAFADRSYNPDGTLVSRSQPGAVVTDIAEVAARAARLASDGVVVAVDGSELRLEAETICLHGDTPAAVSMAHAVRSAVESRGVPLEPFC